MAPGLPQKLIEYLLNQPEFNIEDFSHGLDRPPLSPNLTEEHATKYGNLLYEYTKGNLRELWNEERVVHLERFSFLLSAPALRIVYYLLQQPPPHWLSSDHVYQDWAGKGYNELCLCIKKRFMTKTSAVCTVLRSALTPTDVSRNPEKEIRTLSANESALRVFSDQVVKNADLTLMQCCLFKRVV
jgi:hypothetical protein